MAYLCLQVELQNFVSNINFLFPDAVRATFKT